MPNIFPVRVPQEETKTELIYSDIEYYIDMFAGHVFTVLLDMII